MTLPSVSSVFSATLWLMTYLLNRGNTESIPLLTAPRNIINIILFPYCFRKGRISGMPNSLRLTFSSSFFISSIYVFSCTKSVYRFRLCFILDYDFSVPIKLCGLLKTENLSVQAALLNQLIMRSHLNDASVVEHYYHIGMHDCRDSVCDENSRRTF